MGESANPKPLTPEQLLAQLLDSFVSGRDRSVRLAGLEVALERAYGDEEPFASAVEALASYQPGGGEFLYDEAAVFEVAASGGREVGVKRAQAGLSVFVRVD